MCFAEGMLSAKGDFMQRGVVTYPATIAIRLKPDQAAQLHALAERDDRPPSAYARRLLAEALATRMTGDQPKEGQ